MESINNANNANIELAAALKMEKKQFLQFGKMLKAILRRLNGKRPKKTTIIDETESSEIFDNNFNEMLERRMEAQQNLINEQISGQQETGYCFVENEHGTFYWSSDINQFVAVDRDLISPLECTTSAQRPQIQCC